MSSTKGRHLLHDLMKNLKQIFWGKSILAKAATVGFVIVVALLLSNLFRS